MDTIHNSRLLPTLPMIGEVLQEFGIDFQIHGSSEARFTGVRRYRGQELFPSVLYLTSAGDRFPTDDFAYLCTEPIEGRADHICCPGQSDTELINIFAEVFESFQQITDAISELSYRDASLQDLCALGETLMGNPMVIHDDWFAILAQSPGMADLLPPEQGTGISVRFLPGQWLEDFKFDDDFRETYGHSKAMLWTQDSMQGNNQSIYVNMVYHDRYLGRLLVLGSREALHCRDYAIMELLMQQALVILRSRVSSFRGRSMDMIVSDLVNGTPLTYSDEAAFLDMLHWKRDDPLLCIRMKNQQSDETRLLEHALHSELFSAFPRSYILYRENQQCILLNLRTYDFSIPMLSHMLSPLCRDFLHYAGISSPVQGIRELSVAYTQAGIAMQRAFDLRGTRWIIAFCDCAMDYLLTRLMPPTRLRHLISPQLLQLIEYDKKEDTQYFETLRVYLMLERSVPETSAALIIHRTTLLYRLKKIRSIIGLDLDDPDVRLYLLLSLKMMEQEQLIRPLPELTR